MGDVLTLDVQKSSSQRVREGLHGLAQRSTASREDCDRSCAGLSGAVRLGP